MLCRQNNSNSSENNPGTFLLIILIDLYSFYYLRQGVRCLRGMEVIQST